MDILELIIAIIVLLVAWVIVSIPLWLAAKVLTDGNATMGAAMLGMLLGGIVFVIVYAISYLATDIFTNSSTAVNRCRHRKLPGIPWTLQDAFQCRVAQGIGNRYLGHRVHGDHIVHRRGYLSRGRNHGAGAIISSR